MKSLFIPALAVAAALAVHGVPAAAPGIDATVTRVIDGDTLVVTPAKGGAAVQVRLLDIDAPELCQEWGEESRRYLGEQVMGQTVRLDVRPGAAGRDSQGRLLATVFVADANINVRMVEEGQAWSARTQSNRGPLLKHETLARALRRGLHHAGIAAVAPWDFRLSHGPCAASAGAPAASAAAKPR